MPTPQPTEIKTLATGHSSMTAPSAQLRWSKHGKLQQAWIATRYDAFGARIGQRIEWRDVPTED